MRRPWLVSSIAAAAAAAHAADIGPGGFVARHEVVVAAPAAKVYEALTAQVGAWWNPQHTYSGDSRNLSLDARAGGCFCERLPDGGVEHMRVVNLKTNQLLRLVGALGPLQGSGVAATLTWRLSPAEAATKVELTYVVGGYFPGGFDAIAPAVEAVLREQVERVKRFVETGKPDAGG